MVAVIGNPPTEAVIGYPTSTGAAATGTLDAVDMISWRFSKLDAGWIARAYLA
jgi:hypothetical protein